MVKTNLTGRVLSVDVKPRRLLEVKTLSEGIAANKPHPLKGSAPTYSTETFCYKQPFEFEFQFQH